MRGKGGLFPEEAKKFAVLLEEAGVDMIQVAHPLLQLRQVRIGSPASTFFAISGSVRRERPYPIILFC